MTERKHGIFIPNKEISRPNPHLQGLPPKIEQSRQSEEDLKGYRKNMFKKLRNYQRPFSTDASQASKAYSYKISEHITK